MGSMRLCNLAGEFSKGDKGTKAIPGKPKTELGWRATCSHRDVSSRTWQTEDTYEITPVRLAAPPACFLGARFSQSQGRSQHRKQDQPWDAPRVGRRAEKGWRVSGHTAACTMSPTVPSNPDCPALPETSTPMDHHGGSCFPTNLSVLWTTLCKN